MAGHVAGEEERDLRDLFWLRRPTHRNRREEGLLALHDLFRVVNPEEARHSWCVHGPGSDAIHADVVDRMGEGHRSHQRDDADDVVATHLRGAFLLCRAVVPAMRAQGWGRIANISGISALAHAGRANYVAAKAGLEGFTRALAHETAGDGVTVNAVGPGVTGMTALGAERRGRTFEEHVEALRQTVPVGRVGTPYDIARAVAFPPTRRPTSSPGRCCTSAVDPTADPPGAGADVTFPPRRPSGR
jgi:NAD(P)-dependent dehydrogenase (short-subunit alcohol dehydrogenase family)